MPERRKTDATAGWIGCATATSEDSSTKCIRMLHPNDLSLVHYFYQFAASKSAAGIELVFDAVRVGDSDALG
jgi:hypothetical protein